jgi:hypothetical protein
MAEDKQNFNLTELMSQINLKDYMGENNQLDKKLVEMEKQRKEQLRQKLRNKTNSLRNNRMSKNVREQGQIESLKSNPAFQNLNSEEEIKKAIDMVASSMSKDSKQKKNIKKQMENLVDKMNTDKLLQ